MEIQNSKSQDKDKKSKKFGESIKTFLLTLIFAIVLFPFFLVWLFGSKERREEILGNAVMRIVVIIMSWVFLTLTFHGIGKFTLPSYDMSKHIIYPAILGGAVLYLLIRRFRNSI